MRFGAGGGDRSEIGKSDGGGTGPPAEPSGRVTGLGGRVRVVKDRREVLDISSVG